MTHKEYNGYTNYETWVIALWLDNERGTHDVWRETAREMLAADPATATSDLADALKQCHEDALPELQGFAADLLGAAMSEVDWYDIAENLITSAKEE